MRNNKEFVKEKHETDLPGQLTFHETLQLPASTGMPKLPKCLCLYLSDTFSGNTEIATDLFQGMVSLFTNAESHSQDLFLPWREGGKHLSCLLSQPEIDDRIPGRKGIFVLYEIT